ncbi:peptidoglycan DD-metalloendopeptidase family protein [Pseudalkalibacillus decolorationis]|uniref:peptidoglycan DD-metalloendopeptidase family protein n=1 Tax=Pseudalkalibacillus decolorationis TaxID=163879 RepID=UPI002148555A|nr:peptidoglycan DD-metalloendopeptidase family protein [Pseudalkalibacillus decolorationis]
MKKALGFLVIVSFMFLLIIHTTDEVSAEGSARSDSESDWEWPVIGELTDHFGTRGGNHYGVDIAAPSGSEVRVVEDGTVKKSYYSTSYGHVVFVRHVNGLETVYAHLSERLVPKGKQVKRGTIIGTVGNTGNSHGNHLHFEVHEGEWNAHKTKAVDPVVYFDQTLERVTVEAETIETASTMKSNKSEVTVQKGDTLWGIANEYGVTVDTIKEWNHLKTDLIVVGQTLNVLK